MMEPVMEHMESTAGLDDQHVQMADATLPSCPKGDIMSV